MYHYVRPKNIDYPYFKYCTLENFRRQLDYFDKNFGFLSFEDYKNTIKYNRNSTGVVLSFDDGLKDHFQYVLPELRKRGLWGLFYVNTGTFSLSKLLGVHRVHFLKGKYSSQFILEKVLKRTNDKMIDKRYLSLFKNETYVNSNYNDDERRLQRLLNFYLHYEYRDQILNELAFKYLDEKMLHQQTYLNKCEVIDLIEAGNIVGAHSVNHFVLSRLSVSQQSYEINESFDFLNSLYEQEYKSFCYPYGYDSSFNNDTLKILKDINVNDACVFDNKHQELPIDRFRLSRIDCNKFYSI